MATTTTTTLKDFEIICKLGDGSFAEVFKVLRKEDAQLYAMKKVQVYWFRWEWPESNKRIEITLWMKLGF